MALCGAQKAMQNFQCTTRIRGSVIWLTCFSKHPELSKHYVPIERSAKANKAKEDCRLETPTAHFLCKQCGSLALQSRALQGKKPVINNFALSRRPHAGFPAEQQ